jgi:hypothetical protein
VSRQNTSTRSSSIRSEMRGFNKSRIEIWVCTGRVLDQMHHLEQVEPDEIPRGDRRIKENVEVAVGPCVATRP